MTNRSNQANFQISLNIKI